MAHPIRPESYISMDNFYTSTVYSKGAEIVGIYKTLLGTAAAYIYAHTYIHTYIHI
jgi:aminopeptidase N